MKMHIILRNLMLTLMVVLAGAYVYAGEVTVNIKQPFKAGEKTIPPVATKSWQRLIATI